MIWTYWPSDFARNTASAPRRLWNESHREREAVQPAIIKIAERFRRKEKFIRRSADLLEAIDCGSERSERQWWRLLRELGRSAAYRDRPTFLATVPEENADMSELHQFRIRAKTLRYTIELLASALGSELRETHYRTIEEVQERLGKINDHVAARDQLRDWAADTSDVELQDVLCRFAEGEVAQLAVELAAWHEWWTAETRISQLREGLGRAA